MSDDKRFDLPSDEDLGITDEDIERYGDEFSSGEPEMSPEEMAALLGEAPPPPEPSKTVRKPSDDKPRRHPKKTRRPSPRAARAERTGAGPNEAESAETESAEPARHDRPKVTEGPRSSWRGFATLGLLAGIALISSLRTGLPAPVPANAPDSGFSSARAMSLLVDIARKARPTGSAEHTRVRGTILDRLTALGLDPEVQTVVATPPAHIRDRVGDAVLRVATVRNIVARIPGTASTGTVLVTAHYDSRGISRGASDDGAGVVAILEGLRAIFQGPPLANDLVVLITDAEELGLMGAEAFVTGHELAADVRLVISLEMRGGSGPVLMFETGTENGWVINELRSAVPGVRANSMMAEAYRRLPNDTDFTVFRDRGVQGLNFAAIGSPHIYHQAFDSPANVSEHTLQHQGEQLVSALLRFGSVSLDDVHAPDAVFFTVPWVGLIEYDPGLVVLFLVGVVLAWRGGWGIRGMAVGVVLGLAGIGLSFAAGHFAMGWAGGFHAERGALSAGSFHNEGWYFAAVTLAALAIVSALHGVARAWFRLADLTLGAAFIPFGLAVVLTFTVPLVAMNLQFPVAAALTAAVVALLLGKLRHGIVGWIFAVALTLPVFVLLEPLRDGIWWAIGIGTGAGAIGALAAITFQLALPAVDALRNPNGWWAPTSLGLAAAACLGVGVWHASPAPDRPAPSTLAYAYDHASGDAHWITEPADEQRDSVARQWAVARAGVPFDTERDLSSFGYAPSGASRPSNRSSEGASGPSSGPGLVPTARATPVPVPPPTVEVLDNADIHGEASPETRRMTISVTSGIGAELMQFHLPGGGDTRILSVNGVDVADPDALVRVDHWGAPDSSIVLELVLSPNTPVELAIVEHLLDPEAILGPGSFSRPASLSPNVARMSDRAMLRYPLATLLTND